MLGYLFVLLSRCTSQLAVRDRDKNVIDTDLPDGKTQWLRPSTPYHCHS